MTAQDERMKCNFEADIDDLLNRFYRYTGLKPVAIRFQSVVEGTGYLAHSAVIECAPLPTAEPNAHVAEPFRDILNNVSKGAPK